MTWNDLRRSIDAMTPEQLDMPVVHVVLGDVLSLPGKVEVTGSGPLIEGLSHGQPILVDE